VQHPLQCSMIVADHFLCVMSGLIHTERGVTTGSKIMFSLSSVILFNMIGVDSCVFFNLYDKSRPENQTKRGEIDFFRTISKSFSLCFWFEKNRFPGDPQKHFGNSARYPPLSTQASARRLSFIEHVLHSPPPPPRTAL